jgi:hypothetical protein
LKSQINDLNDNDYEPAWDDFVHFSSFDNSDSKTDYPWEVTSAVYDSSNDGMPGKSNNQSGLTESKNTNNANREPKDIGETHMTPDRMKILQDYQASLNQQQARYNQQQPLGSMRRKEYEPIKASKSRKLKKETKVGGWLSKLTSSIKEGWAEMMEEKEVIDIEENVNETSEIKIDNHTEIANDELLGVVESETIPIEINEIKTSKENPKSEES